MKILAIETSCDETAAALLKVTKRKVTVLSNIISSQIKLHAKYGGVVPSLAAREHVKNLPRVLKLALGKIKIADVDLIAVTRGPGLISSLLVGTTFAQTLAWKYKKPIIGVNHLEGHIASNWLKPVGEILNFAYSAKSDLATNARQFSILKDKFPAICLIVSGGHTELVLMSGLDKYRLVGQTLDDAAGEAFDKIARILGLGYPGGPVISSTAEKFSILNLKFKIPSLPRPMLTSKDLNFSFSGLKTAVLYLTRDLVKKGIKIADVTPQIAAEAQQAIVDVLVAKTIHAAERYKVKSIMLSGGVSANKLLRSELERASRSLEISFFRPEIEYTTDNAAMIAMAGYFSAKGGSASGGNYKQKTDWQSVKVDSNLNIGKFVAAKKP